MAASPKRDERGVNRMDAWTREVHARLEAWARWGKGDDHGPGWPPRTLLARTIEQGPMGASQGGPAPTSMPDDIAVTDAAVASLAPAERVVIEEAYLRPAPRETLWKQCAHVGVRSMAHCDALLRVARAKLWGLIQ